MSLAIRATSMTTTKPPTRKQPARVTAASSPATPPPSTPQSGCSLTTFAPRVQGRSPSCSFQTPTELWPQQQPHRGGCERQCITPTEEPLAERRALPKSDPCLAGIDAYQSTLSMPAKVALPSSNYLTAGKASSGSSTSHTGVKLLGSGSRYFP